MYYLSHFSVTLNTNCKKFFENLVNQSAGNRSWRERQFIVIMDDLVTPRVNAATIPAYVGKNVRIVGRVHQSPTPDGQAVIISSDGQEVYVNTLPTSAESWVDPYVEIIGSVAEDSSITEIFSTNFGNNFNMENHNTLVILAQSNHELFM